MILAKPQILPRRRKLSKSTSQAGLFNGTVCTAPASHGVVRLLF